MNDKRKEYLRDYYKENRDRIKKQNKANYLKRKQQLNENEAKYRYLLTLLEDSKKKRITNMSPQRLHRKKVRQEQIYRELQQDNLTLSM